MAGASVLTSAIIAKETLINFQNNLVVAGNCDWKYSKEFGKKDNPIGNTYNVRRPIMVNVQENNMAWVAGSASILDTTVQLVIDRTLTVPMAFNDADLTLKITDFSGRYVSKAARMAASRLDFRILDSIVNSTVSASIGSASLQTAGLSASAVGTPNAAGYVVGAYGTALTPATVLEAKTVLLELGCPDDGEIYGVLTPKAQAELNAAQSTLFNPLMNTDSLYKKGKIGEYAGIDFAASQSCATHTNGSLGTLAVTSGTAASGWTETASLVVTSSSGINPGDVFVSASVYRLNPLNKQPISHKAQFQVVSVTDSTHVVVSPAPITAGPYANVSATIDSTSLTLVGSTGATGQESIIFHSEAIAVASPDIVVPRNLDMAELIKDEDVDGFVLRFLRGYDIVGASGSFGGGVGTGGPGFISRLDSFWGVKTTNNDFIVRVRN